MVSRRSLLAALPLLWLPLLWLPRAADAGEAEAPAVIKRGREFLAGLFDAELDLLPEFRGSKTYWLFHDNYLAARVLKPARPDLSAKIEAALKKHGHAKSGKIEIVFGESTQALPFRRYAHCLNEKDTEGRAKQ